MRAATHRVALLAAASPSSLQHAFYRLQDDRLAVDLLQRIARVSLANGFELELDSFVVTTDSNLRRGIGRANTGAPHRCDCAAAFQFLVGNVHEHFANHNRPFRARDCFPDDSTDSQTESSYEVV